MDENNVAIRVTNLGKQYRIGEQQARYRTIREVITGGIRAPFRRAASLLKGQVYGAASLREEIWALKEITFEVKRGEVLGIIGRNGAGKTTLLKILSQITEPSEGSAEIRGRVGSLLEVGTGMHPELTGRENIYLNGAILGMKRAEINHKFDDIIEFSGVKKFIDTPMKHYSSGMQVRLAFSIAANLEPEILLVDEVLAVGDAEFQRKCLGKMDEVVKEGRTVLFVSHNMGAVLNLCSRGILLNASKVKMEGPIQQVVDSYINESLELEGTVTFSEDRPIISEDLRFISARILNNKDQVTTNIGMKEGLNIEIEYQVFQSIKSAQIAFELYNSMGVCVLCSTDLDENPEDVKETTAPGHYVAKCFIPPLYLRSDRYWIDIGSSIPGMMLLDEIRQAISFEVFDAGESAESKLAQGRRGIIIPLLEWKKSMIAED